MIPKSFITLAIDQTEEPCGRPGANVIKLFMAVSYKF